MVIICSRFWTETSASTPSQRSDILDHAVQRARIRLQILLRVSSIVSVQLSFAMAARICDGPRRWNTVLVDWHFGLALIFLKTGLTCCILVSHCAVCATYELVKVTESLVAVQFTSRIHPHRNLSTNLLAEFSTQN